MTVDTTVDVTSFTLRPRTPQRAIVAGGVCLVAGILLVSLTGGLGWATVVMILGWLLVVVGVGLLGIVLYAMRAMAVHVEIDDDGYRVEGPSLHKEGLWSDVSKVALTPDGSHMVIAHGQVRRTHLQCPRGGDDPQMKALVSAISERLTGEVAAGP